MNEPFVIEDQGANWGCCSVENISSKSPIEVHILEHLLDVCTISKHAIKELTHSLIKIAFLPDSR